MAHDHGLEVPPLRVSRAVSACSRCRRAKIKCDGKLPACSACEKAGNADLCSSSNDQFAKGKDRSYVAALESRIEKLKSQIAQAKHQYPETTQRSSVKSRTIPNGRAAKEATNVDELVSDFGLL